MWNVLKFFLAYRFREEDLHITPVTPQRDIFQPRLLIWSTQTIYNMLINEVVHVLTWRRDAAAAPETLVFWNHVRVTNTIAAWLMFPDVSLSECNTAFMKRAGVIGRWWADTKCKTVTPESRLPLQTAVCG